MYGIYIESFGQEKNLKYRKEEMWMKIFDEKKYACLLEVYGKLRLDLFIVDFGIHTKGKLLLFEAIPCFKHGILTSINNNYSYHTPHIMFIKKAIREMIIKGANIKANGQQ